MEYHHGKQTTMYFDLYVLNYCVIFHNYVVYISVIRFSLILVFDLYIDECFVYNMSCGRYFAESGHM